MFSPSRNAGAPFASSWMSHNHSMNATSPYHPMIKACTGTAMRKRNTPTDLRTSERCHHLKPEKNSASAGHMEALLRLVFRDARPETQPEQTPDEGLVPSTTYLRVEKLLQSKFKRDP